MLPRLGDGRCVAAVGNTDSGIAEQAGLVPRGLRRYRRSAPHLHGPSRARRKESQLPEYSESRESAGHYPLGASRRIRKGRVRETREPQDTGRFRRQPRQGTRTSGDYGAQPPRAERRARRERRVIKERSPWPWKRAENQAQKIPVTQSLTNPFLDISPRVVFARRFPFQATQIHLSFKER